MPVVNSCTVDTCAYNDQHSCHALAITVGNTSHAQCDTFFSGEEEGGDPMATAQVGACKMSDCQHNTQLECQAPGISVGYEKNQVDCLTYAPA
ncbi:MULTISPECIES: DUF1540 domain-containing protein [unclassified Nocardiopsis]|uniref:DUF1540 domain-containing protein n=1 Tax=unclassified Nocardiopsis TaxID=2649073 RepID=UPI001F41BA59|nr:MULTISPECIES: DUF1540 domain-containing protein [unclassified Nocardiopsis]